MSPSRLERAIQKDLRLCVGVLSGTSVDAAEAALCMVEGRHATAKLTLVAHRSVPFEAELSAVVRSAKSPQEICELNFVLGERFAQAALEVIAQAKLSPEQIDVIGSHGQTIAHLPRGVGRVPSTLQIGEASVIAERTGIPTVSDFRTRDVASGGQGAPLVPYADWVMFRKTGVHRAMQNIGGIGNVSVIGERLDEVIAFDTGPGNLVLDALARRATGGQLSCDLDGSLSRQGRPIPALLDQLLTHPFLAAEPPKSAGWETFGDPFASSLWEHHQRSPHDLIATAVAFTVESIARAYERWILPRFRLEASYLSGGGSRNPTLTEGLARRLAPLPVRPLDDLGFPEAAKEAACFALLASECLHFQPQNVPSATGAARPVVMGKISP